MKFVMKKLTPAQQLVKNRIDSGDRLVHVWKNRSDGGQTWWIKRGQMQRMEPVRGYGVNELNWQWTEAYKKAGTFIVASTHLSYNDWLDTEQGQQTLEQLD